MRTFDRSRLPRSSWQGDARIAAWRSAGRSMTRERATRIVATVALLGLVATWAFGMPAAGVFLIATMALIAMAPGATSVDILRFLPLLLLPLLAIASSIWSDAPARTLRAALQLALTCVAAIVICRRMSASSMVLALFGALLGVVLLTLPGVPFALSHHTPLGSGLLGSKNEVGFAAQMLIALSFAVLVDGEQPTLARIASLPAVAVALGILALSQSAGAEASLAVTLVTLCSLLVFGKVSMPVRIAILVILMLMLVAAAIFLPDLQGLWAAFRTNVLKKDATLTGRTYLWDVAARLSVERPWLGHGYYAFWRQGNLDAEGLWRWGGIASRSGFNFHNAFVEMRVDLGWIGQGLFIATCAGVAVVGFTRQLLRPSVPMALLFSLVVAIYIHSYAESGMVGPFSLPTLLWIATAVYGASSLRVEARAPAAPTRGQLIVRPNDGARPR